MPDSGMAAGRPEEAAKAGQADTAARAGNAGKARAVPVWARKSTLVLLITLLALAALLILPASRHWKTRTKYDAPGAAGTAAAAGPVDEIDSWDRLSRGEDPT
jgi:hypothetical protein